MPPVADTVPSTLTLSDADAERWADAVILGRRAATGDADALAALAEPGGGAMRDGRGVPVYVDQQMFAEVVGANTTYLRRLHGKGRLIDPEVSAARVRGWSIGRVIMWAIEYGYLNTDLTRVMTRRGRTEIIAAGALDVDSRPHWRWPNLVAYLTQIEAAAFLGVTDGAIYRGRTERESGPLEAIRIGDLGGWDLEGLRAYNATRHPNLRKRSQEPGLTSI